VTDVGNGHQQPPAFAPADFGRLSEHCIVKIPRILAIDGDQWNIRKVDPMQMIIREDTFGQSTGLRQCGLGKRMRHAIFANRNFDLHPRVVNLPQHLRDAANRLTVKRRRFCQFNHHHLTGLCASQSSTRDEYILPISLVFRRNQPSPTFLQ
jgi:hypothetical protein